MDTTVSWHDTFTLLVLYLKKETNETGKISCQRLIEHKLPFLPLPFLPCVAVSHACKRLTPT